MSNLYFSSLLKQIKRYNPFYKRLKKTLNKLNVKYYFVEGTKDIWMRDFMPVKSKNKLYVQFRYEPSYLKKHKHTITNGYEIAKKLGITPLISNIKLDGGNFVYKNGVALITSRIFKENPKYKKNKLLKDIKHILKLKKIILIPDEHDEFGHSDGLVRFITEKKVVINSYSKKDVICKNNLIAALKKAVLKCYDIPCVAKKDAIGLYINYLQFDSTIILPVYDIQTDAEALKIFKKIFPKYKIIPLLSTEIAKQGGVLNCISWLD